jgi:hypothetical protein
MNLLSSSVWSMKSLLSLLIVLIAQFTDEVLASSKNNYDSSVYGLSQQRDWMYESGSINMQYHGCVWGYVNDRENMACMEDESGDGTTYWYQMANCRRAQVAYSLYASSNTGSSRCNNGNWKESVSSLIDVIRHDIQSILFCVYFTFNFSPVRILLAHAMPTIVCYQGRSFRVCLHHGILWI